MAGVNPWWGPSHGGEDGRFVHPRPPPLMLAPPPFPRAPHPACQLERAQHQRDALRLKDLEGRLAEEQELKVGTHWGVVLGKALPLYVIRYILYAV